MTDQPDDHGAVNDDVPAKPPEPTVDKGRWPKWVIPVGTMIVGVVATVLVTIYQVNLEEKRAQEAEIEKAKAVRASMIDIIEEHVLHEKPLEIPRLRRMLDFKTREANLQRAIPISDVIEKAEFNIVNSQYLDFERKEAFKLVFDQIYNEIATPTLDYQGRHVNIVDDLVDSIQKGKSSEAISKLRRVLEAFNSEMDALADSQKVDRPLAGALSSLIEKPYVLLTFPLVMIVVWVWFFLILQRRRMYRHRRMIEMIYESKVQDEYLLHSRSRASSE